MSNDITDPDPSDDDGEGTADSDENQNNNRTKMRLKAYDLEVQAESADASFEEMAETLSEEFEKIRRDAMVAEYQEIEERNLHSVIFGGDD